MILITRPVVDKIEKHFLKAVSEKRYQKAALLIVELEFDIYDGIPDKNRISVGRYTAAKALTKELYEHVIKNDIPLVGLASTIYDKMELTKDEDIWAKIVAIGLLSYCDLKDLNLTLTYFERSAASENWIERECSAGFMHRLIKAYPENIRNFYLRLQKSKNPNQRRFVSESLRPVAENRWMREKPEFALSILSNMFAESSPYPRTSLGNNLSDWANSHPEMVYTIIERLAGSGNKDSYWIAYRACRNLVKKEPERVMDLLAIDEYSYKKKKYERNSGSKISGLSQEMSPDEPTE